MLQFLCLQMCVYGGGVVPQGGVGDRRLVTIPQGVVGDRLPWGGERHGGVRVQQSRAAIATICFTPLAMNDVGTPGYAGTRTICSSRLRFLEEPSFTACSNAESPWWANWMSIQSQNPRSPPPPPGSTKASLVWVCTTASPHPCLASEHHVLYAVHMLPHEGVCALRLSARYQCRHCVMRRVCLCNWILWGLSNAFLSRYGASSFEPSHGGRYCHGACAVQTLGKSEDPPGDNSSHQEAPRKKAKTTQKPLEYIGNHGTTRGRHVLCL